MYSRNSWGGSVDPFISIKFLPYQTTGEDDKSDPLVATVIFDWKDEHLIGVFAPDDPYEVRQA